ncbi:MAG: endonuclease/exonuclease/phosphatase family protein [Bacteroidales bacterium]|jgi:endonuclease/exonuclease/phosphatase family metal-dependent hydrolase|nr:endonuclease/exonuclease/phosphatase family protein [Bacteroidales bacterium]MCK9498202.1 endonuclease/exonuclease/phosphatase family protein [Bacteroidales bacterium]MDY0313627.1 endonuclease/exonuclease/phosphatase family protein [Bacteroidales bacterium]
MKIFKRILLITNIISSIVLLCVYGIEFIPVSKFLFISILPFLFTIALSINLIFLLVWIFINWKYSLISLLSILLVIKYIVLIYPISSFFSKKTNEAEFKVMTYNVMVFGLYDWENKNIRTDIIQLISNENPDILCLQETYWNNSNNNFKTLDLITENLNAEHIYKASMTTAKAGQNFGFATISKYPILNSYSEKFENSFNGFTYSDILLNTDTVRVYNLHLQSLEFNQKDYTVLENISEGINELKIKSLLKKYLKSVKLRINQAEIVKTTMSNCNYPIIVCGDFNDIPISYSYLKIAKNLKDSFSSKGKFPGYTWVNSKLKLRLDYILYSKDFKCSSHKVIDKELSDHFPVVAEFRFNKK